MRTYSLADVHATFDELLVTGTADDAITITTNEDLYSLQRGGDGKDFTRVRNNDWSALITVRARQGSSLNDAMSAIMVADKLGAGVKRFQLKDLNGTTLITAPRVWLKKVPEIGFGREAGEREWVFETDRLFPEVIGGATP
jgi:hypothetical protein